MWMIFEARNETSTVKYLGLFCYMPTVITNNRSGVQCWNTTKSKLPGAFSFVRRTLIPTNKAACQRV